MYVLKSLSSETENLLQQIQEIGYLTHHRPVVNGSRSTIYKIDQYCLKVYTRKGRTDGINESQALLALQGTHVPELFAYLPGVFVLMEWINGLNLMQYKMAKGLHPATIVYDFYRTELEQRQVGYRDWDIKWNEHFIWLESGEVKRIDLGICDPVPDAMKVSSEKSLVDEIEKTYNRDPETIYDLTQKLYRHAYTNEEANQALDYFISRTPRLV